MAKLFICNTSKRYHDFFYWAGENRTSPLRTRIEPGKQAQIYQDAPMDELMHIVQQHQVYGLLPIKDIRGNRDFSGLAYQFDKPIEVEKIHDAIEQLVSQALEEGAERRKQAAYVVDSVLTSQSQEHGTTLRGVEVEIREETARDGRETKVNETLTVQREGRRSRKG